MPNSDLRHRFFYPTLTLMIDFYNLYCMHMSSCKVPNAVYWLDKYLMLELCLCNTVLKIKFIFNNFEMILKFKLYFFVETEICSCEVLCKCMLCKYIHETTCII